MCSSDLSQADADGNAVTQAFRDSHHVRQDTGLLVAEERTGTAIAGLDLVQYQQPFPVIADLPERRQVIIVRHLDAALSLDRFNHDSNDILVVLGDLPDGVDIIVGHADKALHQGFETRLDFPAAGGGQCCQGPAVE